MYAIRSYYGLVLVVIVLANLRGLNRTESVKVAEVTEGKIVEQIYTIV